MLLETVIRLLMVQYIYLFFFIFFINNVTRRLAAVVGWSRTIMHGGRIHASCYWTLVGWDETGTRWIYWQFCMFSNMICSVEPVLVIPAAVSVGTLWCLTATMLLLSYSILKAFMWHIRYFLDVCSWMHNLNVPDMDNDKSGIIWTIAMCAVGFCIFLFQCWV